MTPSDESLAPAGLLVFSFQANGITITEAGIPGTAPASAFRVYAEASGDFNHHEAGSVQSGFALTNSGDTTAGVSWELFSLDGMTTGLRGSTNIPAQGHVPCSSTKWLLLREFKPLLKDSFASATLPTLLRPQSKSLG